MITLLIIIYLAFISLGLPDSLLGSAWPVIHKELSIPISNMGIITVIISGGTIISSYFSGYLIKKFGTFKITVTSVFLTAVAIFGFYLAPNLISMCLLAVPLGIGAGAIDSALNNFVALHYSALHMNWLHCFWGVGASIGPLTMSYFIKNNSWRKGYLVVSIVQFSLLAILILSARLWKKVDGGGTVSTGEVEEHKEEKINIYKIRGLKLTLLTFLCYCAIETSMGAWTSTYFVETKGFSPDVSAKWASLFFIGITLGRFLSGFGTKFFSNKKLIRYGEILIIVGLVILSLPLGKVISIFALLLIGFGCAPIYPATIFETPSRFGKEHSQTIIGVQMASAYLGSTIAPPIVGFILSKTSFSYFQILILAIAVLMLASSEYFNIILKSKQKG